MTLVVSTTKRYGHSGLPDSHRSAEISEKVTPPRNTTSTTSPPPCCCCCTSSPPAAVVPPAPPVLLAVGVLLLLLYCLAGRSTGAPVPGSVACMMSNAGPGNMLSASAVWPPHPPPGPGLSAVSTRRMEGARSPCTGVKRQWGVRQGSPPPAPAPRAQRLAHGDKRRAAGGRLAQEARALQSAQAQRVRVPVRAAHLVSQAVQRPLGQPVPHLVGQHYKPQYIHQGRTAVDQLLHERRRALHVAPLHQPQLHAQPVMEQLLPHLRCHGCGHVTQPLQQEHRGQALDKGLEASQVGALQLAVLRPRLARGGGQPGDGHVVGQVPELLVEGVGGVEQRGAA
eukprot:CAMPEP_0202871952 /NCGR_PEP_ID=MMETSP1391-20130828/20074_1 /ASSEMBLY_ACC=CAM_ASM_000867 /TAXON_ID=1034604 /ORGANISM="Chlamydomonas leiostraca, Strain SAG 11-49" /LENGTH=338 /DNA_ID=CAMNT_0049552883 /DNA_START=265 /DNA_END=1279 /DNA_ORIENTATION=+